MNPQAAVLSLLLGTGLLAAAAAAAPSEPRVLGGVTPDRRLEGLPVVKETGLTPAGRQRAMHGISKPYPPNLEWLDRQGGWYTPFTHPGMTAPYDIRHWHRESND